MPRAAAARCTWESTGRWSPKCGPKSPASRRPSAGAMFPAVCGARSNVVSGPPSKTSTASWAPPACGAKAAKCAAGARPPSARCSGQPSTGPKQHRPRGSPHRIRFTNSPVLCHRQQFGCHWLRRCSSRNRVGPQKHWRNPRHPTRQWHPHRKANSGKARTPRKAAAQAPAKACGAAQAIRLATTADLRDGRHIAAGSQCGLPTGTRWP